MDRQIERVLLDRLAKWRCVALLGPRQVGKSYLLKTIIQRYGGSLFSFDDPLERAEAAKDPVRYVEQRYEPGRFLFLDEAARVPEIFSAIKLIVDRHGSSPTGICLANSGNYLLLRRVKESLAGRVALLSMYPLSWQECHGATATRPGLLDLLEDTLPAMLPKPISFVEVNRQREERLLWGGFPGPTLLSDRTARIIWCDDYVRTYLLPLVIEQFGVRDTGAFERCAQLLFANTGQLINAQRLGQLVGVSQPTTAKYLHQLTAMMVVETTPQFLRNLQKRTIKQPRCYVTDALLINKSLGAGFSLRATIDRGHVGSLYESFVFAELKKTIANHDLRVETFTWRTQDKTEVDLILVAPDRLLPLEIKWSTAPAPRDTSGLKAFLRAYPDVPRGYIVYPGERIQTIAEKILAIPDWWLLGASQSA